MSPVASALVCEGPHNSKLKSTFSASLNFSYAVAISALVATKSSVPLASETLSTLNAFVKLLSKVVPFLATPSDKVEMWSIQ